MSIHDLRTLIDNGRFLVFLTSCSCLLLLLFLLLFGHEGLHLSHLLRFFITSIWLNWCLLYRFNRARCGSLWLFWLWLVLGFLFGEDVILILFDLSKFFLVGAISLFFFGLNQAVTRCLCLCYFIHLLLLSCLQTRLGSLTILSLFCILLFF